jgi:hypothetical protein
VLQFSHSECAIVGVHFWLLLQDVVSAPARRNTPTDHQQQQPVVVVASVAAGDSHGLPASSPATLIDADHFRVVLTTTKGDVTLELRREWAPLGVDRFREMVSGGFFASSTTNKGIGAACDLRRVSVSLPVNVLV